MFHHISSLSIIHDSTNVQAASFSDNNNDNQIFKQDNISLAVHVEVVACTAFLACPNSENVWTRIFAGTVQLKNERLMHT